MSAPTTIEDIQGFAVRVHENVARVIVGKAATIELLLVALLCGAFFASFDALFGGRQRDRVQWLEGHGADYDLRHANAPIR